MLDYHGLAGHPAERAADVAGCHHIYNSTITNWAKALTAAGSIAAHTLATTGAQPLSTPQAEVGLARRSKTAPNPTDRQLVAALTALGAVTDPRSVARTTQPRVPPPTGRWQPPSPAES
jgi:hypothetical protein